MSLTPAQADQLTRWLARGPLVVLTGAGLSTASGIPAYRDHSGQWQHTRPIQHQDFLASAATRQRYWARSFVGWQTMSQAQPNAGHRALATLEAAGRVRTLITQNVDGLHHAAGSAAVIELHGALRQVCCLACAARYARALVQQWLAAANPAWGQGARDARTAPDGDAHLAEALYADFVVPACPECAGVLKPDVVFFGDNVPRERVTAAQEAVAAASTLLVVGSSLMVYSGFRFAEQAHRLGVPVVAINQGVTRADALLSLKVEADCASALMALAALPLG